jgi:hypothetical protein
MTTEVRITRHKLKNGKVSLFLSFRPYFYDTRAHKVIKTENLKLWVFDKPKTAEEKK